MNSEKVIFGFFIIMSLTLNFGFFIGDIDNIAHHNIYELFAAITVNMIATILKFGDRTHLGAIFLASSLVADLQLIAAALFWGYAVHISPKGLDTEAVVSVISFSGGALVANIISVILLLAETMTVRR